MSVFPGFFAHIERLVHPGVQLSSFARARHRTFLISRFGLFIAASSAWIVSLGNGHTPGFWEAMTIAWLAVPFVAAAHVSRTGRLDDGEAACLAAWWGLAITTTLSGGTSLFGGCILLLIGPLEATFSDRRSLVNAAVLAAIIGAGSLGLAELSGLLPSVANGAAIGDAIVAVPALLFIVILARCSLSLQQLQQQLVVAGEERYRVLTEAIGDLVLRYDRVGGVVMASRQAEQMFGVHPRDLIGRGFFERVHIADRPAFLTLFADAAQTGENVSARLRFRRASSASHPHEPVFAWIEIRARRFDPAKVAEPRKATPRPDSPVVALVRDISIQMDHEHAIESAKQEAERTSRWKDGFLANVSHELRTPLNAIIGFSEMLASDDLSPRDAAKQQDYARIITTSGQHLLSVVNSLLDVSKLEAGCFNIDPEPFAFSAMVRSCCDMIALNAEQANITIQRDITPDAGDIIADKRACKQIVINLLSNALKFSRADGTVTVVVKRSISGVVLSVADTGIGIAERDLKRLGDAFFQAKSGLDRPFEGTGLGLSVVRGLVGLHGGTIAIASEPNEGTQVTVRLPLDCRVAAPPAGTTANIETIVRHTAGSPASRLSAARTNRVA